MKLPTLYSRTSKGAPQMSELENKLAAPEGLRTTGLFGFCCFNCKEWIGKRRKERAYCKRLNLSSKDAPHGDAVCVLWEKRVNARLPNADVELPPSGGSESKKGVVGG